MEQTAKLIEAFSSLLWPLFAFVFLYLFRTEIRTILSRIKKGKILGQEIELGEKLDKLEESVSETRKELIKLPQPEEEEKEKGILEIILNEVTQSPKAALIRLSSEIERETIRILASVGRLMDRNFVPIHQALNEISSQYGGLPGHVSQSIKLFWNVRNQIIHAKGADQDEIIRAIDSGINVLKVLQAIPRETNTVLHPSVQVYKDESCETVYEGVKGVILEKQTSGGTKKFMQIFPTTRNHFKAGKRVAWEWNTNVIFGRAWYKDPITNEIKKAWDSAAEFIGRNIDDI